MARGYPDFVKVDSAADEPNTLLAAANYASPFVSPFIECSRWQAVTIDFLPTGVAQQVIVQWAGNSDGSGTVFPLIFDVGAGQRLNVTLPNRGNSVQVQAQYAGAGPQAASLVVTLTNRLLQPVALTNVALLIAQTGIVLAGGASTTLSFANAFTGDTDIAFSCDAAVWSVNFQALDYSGAAFRTLFFNQVQGSPFLHRQYFPPMRNRAVITNGDGVNRTFNLSVIPRVLLS